MKREKYDVVVVGSGTGGLCAAARLAYGGYKALVVEKLPVLGGRCSTFEYKGFKLSTGAISLPTYGGPVERTFEEVRACYEVRPLPRDVLIHYRIRGDDYPVPEKEGMKALISFASSKEEAEAVMSALEQGMIGEASSTTSLRDWLLQYTQNQAILEVFHAIVAGHYALNIHELPASEFFQYLNRPVILQLRGFAPQGSMAIMESLAEVIRRHDGQVWTRCQAKRIVVADHTARGIIVDRRGEEFEIATKAVVSNTGPRKTVELAGRENFDAEYLKEVSETLKPSCFVIIYISMPRERPFMEPVRMYLTGIRRVFGIRCLTKVCPELAPPDRHLLYASAIPGSSLPPISFKKELDLCVKDLKENLPGFEKYAEILLACCFQGDWPNAHSWPGYDLPQKTPVQNLYNVGDGVKPQGFIGLEACAESASIVVEDIKNRIAPGYG